MTHSAVLQANQGMGSVTTSADHRQLAVGYEPKLISGVHLVQENCEVRAGSGRVVQLGHKEVVVGVEPLGHVQGCGTRCTTRHGKVEVIAFQILQDRTEPLKKRSD